MADTMSPSTPVVIAATALAMTAVGSGALVIDYQGIAILVGAIGVGLGSLGSFIATMVGLARQGRLDMRQGRLDDRQERMEKTILETKTLVNGMTEKKETLIADKATAEGNLAGRLEERANPMQAALKAEK